jgi:hypothetical protein
MTWLNSISPVDVRMLAGSAKFVLLSNPLLVKTKSIRPGIRIKKGQA